MCFERFARGRNRLLTDWLVYYMQFSFSVKSFSRSIFGYFLDFVRPFVSDRSSQRAVLYSFAAACQGFFEATFGLFFATFSSALSSQLEAGELYAVSFFRQGFLKTNFYLIFLEVCQEFV